MKHSLRFVVAGIVLAGVIFGIWALFLNPDKKISVNDRLSSVNAIADDYEISSLLNEVEKVNQNIFTPSLGEETKNSTLKVFGKADYCVAVKNQIPDTPYNPYSGYVYYHNKIKESYNFYASYGNAISSISNRDLKNIKSHTTQYKNKLEVLANKINAYLKFAESYPEENNSAWFSNLSNKAEDINLAYSYTLGAYARLTQTVRDIAIKYVYGDDYLYSTASILNDNIIYQAVETFANNDVSEEQKIVDLERFCVILEEFNAKQNIFAGNVTTEMELIEGYTKMQKDYYSKLLEYYRQTRGNKYKLTGDSGEKSEQYKFIDCIDHLKPIKFLVFKYVTNL